MRNWWCLFCSCVIPDNEEEEEEQEENDMETEDRDSEEAEKPSITFDPSLPTSHAVSDAQALQFSQSCFSFTELCHLMYIVFSNALTLTPLMAVSGFRHGGVSWPYSPRWRQLSDHPCPAAHSRDAGARSDSPSAALQTTGGQHDAESHTERSHLCCAGTQVGDRYIRNHPTVFTAD